MGNAHAASWGWSSSTPAETAATPPPVEAPPPVVPVEPLPPSSPVDATPVHSKTATNSVGTFEEIHKPCKDIALQPFEGLRFIVNKGLSSHFQAQHTVHLNNEGSSYRFGSTYVGTKQPSPTEAYPVMIGEMSNEGNLQAQFIHQVTSRFKAKCIAQTLGSKLQSVQVGGDVVFNDSTLSVVCADPDLLNGTGMLIVHYLQAITPKLSIGSELLYQRGAARQQAIASIAGRYKTENWQAAGTIAAGGMHASFYRKANENVQVGVELEASLKNKESVTTFAYQMDLPKMNLLFKGMLTSEWTIGSALEKRLQPLPITLNLTGTYNIKKDKVAVGIGAVLG
uniref:Mitochondrial import receptor subunit TOM40 homolog n=1 Tax=Ciona intestinalis TaxID=7719 RepID=A0A1W2WI90_CIOIN|nr:mitochondrial import receptor subunit TOM40 homolog isoform X2 [Ciona intestinalis]XP_009858300.1 mitochondrial import receptor subunit TOM40 homolog isoform X1 [Ciona intestinalis]|eukprot:XP_002131395.1 mitochondrial import receptor subunit TOM40 homolog isoform X2 [Ciona intestinalis]